MAAIPKRRLGRTNLQVTELGLGGFQFTSQFSVPRAEAYAILDHAFAAGINLVDTAPMYGCGESEELVGRALERTDSQVIVSTKVGWLDGTVVLYHGDAAYQDESLLGQVVEHGLRLVGRDQVEILMIHEPEWPQWALNQKTRDAPVMRLLESLKRDGIIGAIGMGDRDCQFMADLIETDRIDVVLSFMHYDLAVHDARARLIPTAKQHDVGVILGGPFRQEALAVRQPERIAQIRVTGEYPHGLEAEVLRRIDALAAETDMELAEMGIRYLLSDPDISTAIPGPRAVAQLEANIASAAKGPLPVELIEKIDQIDRDQFCERRYPNIMIPTTTNVTPEEDRLWRYTKIY